MSNWHIESNEPAFLRKLRGEHSDRDSSRHERPLARPRKQVWEGEPEDQPTYVVEDSQDTLSKAEYEALLAANGLDKQGGIKEPSSAKLRHDIEEAESGMNKMAREAAPVRQQVAGIGRSIKRPLAKAVGDEEAEEEKEDEDEHEDEDEDNGQTATKRGSSAKKNKKTRAKKAKKIKLSFDEVDTEAWSEELLSPWLK